MLFINNKHVNINEEIREKEIRLVSEDDSRVISTREALEMARENDLDLVMISPQAVPPVCRIMDYNKFLYEQSKKKKEVRKNQKIVDIKEIRLSLTIEENDILIKANNAKKFLSNGDKVKVTVRFKGRQNAQTHKGPQVLDAFLAKLDDMAVVEKSAQLEGKSMFMMLAPKK